MLWKSFKPTEMLSDNNNNYNLTKKFYILWFGGLVCTILCLVVIASNVAFTREPTEQSWIVTQIQRQSQNTYMSMQALLLNAHVEDDEDDSENSAFDKELDEEAEFELIQQERLEYEQHLYNSTCDRSKIPHPLPLWRWTEMYNFGDELSLILMQRIVGKKSAVPFNPKEDPFDGTPKMLAVGSIMRLADNCDIVWGTGVKSHVNLPSDTALFDVRAVRGPWSRRALMEANPKLHVPAVYGDPVLLLPYYFPEYITKPEDRKGILVVLHYNDKDASFTRTPGMSVIIATEKWPYVVGNITKHAFVISSSLHGLIVADAFGIPARFLQLNLKEPSFKYKDYYLGTGRNYTAANTIEEAMWLGGESAPIFNPKLLIRSFPTEFFDSVHIPDELK